MKRKTKNILALLALTAAFTACAGLTACGGEKQPEGGFSVEVTGAPHGTVTADRSKAEEGEIVTVTLAPDAGYTASFLKINGTAYPIVDNRVSFAMPAQGVSITCAFLGTLVTESAPDVYAFRLNAYLNRVMAKSVWAYEYGEEALTFSVWAEDRAVNEELDGVRMYFGTDASAYALGEHNVGLSALRTGVTRTMKAEGSGYLDAEVEGASVTVAPWAVEGEDVIGYKVTASVPYSALGFKNKTAAEGHITCYPEFINGNDTSPVPITKKLDLVGGLSRPNGYAVLTGRNKVVRNARFGESATFGDGGGIPSGEYWELEGDTSSTAPDRRVELVGTDGKDNNLIFRHTAGFTTLYAEATFRVTQIFGNERWGKFGFMIFDGSTSDGLFLYADAFVEGAIDADNIVGTYLGYNRANGGWRNWMEIPGSGGSFDTNSRTITFKLAYTGSKIYLYCGDALVFSMSYSTSRVPVLGIRSFNYGIELTDYYATKDANDEKYLAHVPAQENYSNALALTGGGTQEITQNMTMTSLTRTIDAAAGTGSVWVREGDLDASSYYAVLVNGKPVQKTRTVYETEFVSSAVYEFPLNKGENKIAIAYVNAPKDTKVKLLVNGTDMTGGTADWVKGEKALTAQVPEYFFLGSSVTYGATTGGRSFVEVVGETLGAKVVKEAVSGTTLAKAGANSYVERLANFEKSAKPQALIVQLSTNDATQNLPLGTIAEGKELDGFDTTTTIGAMEYIIAYARETWGCDVVFYTNPHFGNNNYLKLVSALYELQQKWAFEIVDFYYCRDMQFVSDAALGGMMSDSIHPNTAGYRWMGEVFSARLRAMFDEALILKNL